MSNLASPHSSASMLTLYHEQVGDIDSSNVQYPVLPVGPSLCGATSVNADSIEWPFDFSVATNSGLSDSLFKNKPPSVQNALHEIKSSTGLTWQQLSRVFKVNQRSLYLWMEGGTLDSLHQERVYRVLTLIRKLPYSKPFQNRTFLLSPQPDGITFLNLLIEGDDDTFIARVAGASAHTITGAASLASDRRPLPVSILLNASQDTVHVDLPGRHIVKAAKRKDSEE